MLIFIIGARRAKLVPGRFQSVLEMGLDFCRTQIAYEILGEKDGKKYVPIITTIFFAVFFFNITGVIPFLNIAGTSVIGLPIIFALWVYFLYLWQGVKKFGVGGYLKHSLFPPGVNVSSAGALPGTEINPHAVKVMQEIGIDISRQRPKPLSDVPLGTIDTVITVCAEPGCTLPPGGLVQHHWALDDPEAVDGPEEEVTAAFRKARDELKIRLEGLLDAAK